MPSAKEGPSLPSSPLQGGLSRGRLPGVPLTKGQQTARLLGCAGPCSSCCLMCAPARVLGRTPATAPRAQFALCQTGWKWRRAQQRPRPRLQGPVTATTVTNLPVPPPPSLGRVPCPIPPESPAPSLWAGLQGWDPRQPFPPPSTLIWPRMGRFPCPRLPPTYPPTQILGWALCKVAYLLSF